MAISGGFSVRVACPEDAEAVTELLEISYSVLWAEAYTADILDAALPLLTKANPVLLAGETFFVAVDENSGKMVGCGGWSMAAPGSGEIDPAVAHVRHFAVHPDETRRGIGRRILELCFDQAIAAGAVRMSCQSSQTAVAFYRDCGFAEAGPMQINLPNGISIGAVRMSRDLDIRAE